MHTSEYLHTDVNGIYTGVGVSTCTRLGTYTDVNGVYTGVGVSTCTRQSTYTQMLMVSTQALAYLHAHAWVPTQMLRCLHRRWRIYMHTSGYLHTDVTVSTQMLAYLHTHVRVPTHRCRR